MGNYLQKVGYGEKPRKVLFLGLDAAGKSTILWKLSRKEPATTIPTIGFTVENFDYQGMEITAWDVGGRSNLRPLWRHYYKSTEGIVFVIDTYDRERLEEASEQLQRLLAEDDLLGIPLLIFANKADLPSKVTLTELSKILKLDSIRRKYHVCSSVATTGVGLLEGMKWLTLAIRSG